MTRTTRRVAAAGAVALGLLALVAAAGLMRPPRLVVARAARRSLAQTLVVSGRVMPPIRVNIGTRVTGIVARRLVEEGTHVAAGEPLLMLDDAEAKAALAQARAATAQAAVKLEQLRVVGLPVAAELFAQAQLMLDRAERELKRTEALAAKGIVTTAQLEDARKDVDVARSQVQSAKVQRAGTGPAGVEERSAAAALEQARANQAAAAIRLEQMVIRAGSAGTIIGRSVEAGDVVQPGQTLLVLAVDGPTLLTIDPDERNLAAIWMGQAATASPDAFPGQSFPATVSFIGAAVDPQRGTVEVRLSVPTPPATLRPDMTVSVELEAGRRNEALSVPADCVRDVTGRAPWVLAVVGGLVERREVRLGLRGDAYVEVLSGVREGDLLVPAGSGAPVPGTKVTPVLPGA